MPLTPPAPIRRGLIPIWLHVSISLVDSIAGFFGALVLAVMVLHRLALPSQSFTGIAIYASFSFVLTALPMLLMFKLVPARCGDCLAGVAGQQILVGTTHCSWYCYYVPGARSADIRCSVVTDAGSARRSHNQPMLWTDPRRGGSLSRSRTMPSRASRCPATDRHPLCTTTTLFSFAGHRATKASRSTNGLRISIRPASSSLFRLGQV